MPAILKQLEPRSRMPEFVDPVEERQRKQVADEAKVKARIAMRKANDPIGNLFNHCQFYADCVPTQIWGRKLIDHFKGPGPKYRFSRWYLSEKIIVDTFMTHKKYDAADVEGRRKLCKLFGFKYAALGPDHSIKPHEDPKLRAQFPSLMEQLGLV